MLSSYYTVKQQDFDQVVIQKSRFIGYVKRVETETEAQDFVQAIKKKHHDATHNCSAYMVGEHNQIQKANDDGEPSGTAGMPMLDVLKKKDLKDTAVVVTRYFGGIKLGAGGLIRAYSSTTSQALAKAGIVERRLMQGISITVDYTLHGKLENALRHSDYIVDAVNYTEHVEFVVYVPDGDEQICRNWIVNLSSNQVTLKDRGTAYVEIDV
ncbi:YigZ family protein [Lentibacillus halophilus]|uniref:YigZ family protein n=1 Tax=Lentibacillus halophilus TaxID=295065 RepID=A0ABN0ZG71_9BACI